MIANKNFVQRRRGFTLVEILIVLAIFSILAAVALPMVRQLVSDQKGANTSRSISAFIDLTRRRAIAEARPMGVLIERLDPTGGTNTPGRSAAIRIRQTLGVPSYSGEASDAFATLSMSANWPAENEVLPGDADPMRGLGDPDPIPGIDTATFDSRDNQLLLLAAQLYASGDASESPIKIGDPIEFPGGRIASIKTIRQVGSNVRIHFDLTENRDYTSTRPYTTQSFPSAARNFGDSQQVKYKVHRRPSRSSTAPYDLPKGAAIDLNYSGMGFYGNEFAVTASGGSHIQIIFAADGRVSTVTNGAGAFMAPTGLIFLCLGNTDGLRSDSLLSTDEKAPANLLNLETIWVVINPSTGRVVSSPNASVSTALPSSALTDLSASSLDTFIKEARNFATSSDTVDNK